MKTELVWESLKSLPALIGAWISSVTLNEVVGFVTVVYIALQAAYLGRKWFREETESSKKNWRQSGLQ